MLRTIWNFIILVLGTAAGLWVATAFVRGVYVTVTALSASTQHPRFWAFMGAAAVIALVNLVVGPIVRLVSLPVTILTLGLFSLVLNGLLLCLSGSIAKALGVGLVVEGLWPAIWAAIIISLINLLLSPISGALRH